MHESNPWYRRVRRWGQTNLTEIDAAGWAPDFWRRYWKETHTGGIIVNAGGIVAYYPSRIPYHYRARHLGDRNLFGEVTTVAREEGLAVLARMDCNRALPELYEAHPDWFVTRRDGSPVETQGRFVTCVNSPYYKEHIPLILREIVGLYHPDGFTDNSWTGADRRTICHCPHCRAGFREATGAELPEQPDWEDETYRRWIRWSYRCREENWDLFNRVTKEAGGDSCVWLGMVGANPFATHLSFADLARIGRRTRDTIFMCDHQSRDELGGFEQNVVNGLLLHAVSSASTVIPQSMAHYVRGQQAFRRASMPAEETRTWMRAGVAGGITPWWHHVGANQEDRRQFATSAGLLRWHAEHDALLHDREPLARVGLVWSHENIDFHGRDRAHHTCALPWRGWTAALTRARIPFVPLHADAVPPEAATFRTLVLPHMAVLSDAQCEALHAYVRAGGTVAMSGPAGAMDETGAIRQRWPFADLVHAAPTGETLGAEATITSSWEVPQGHTYLRFRDAPEARPRFLRFADMSDTLPFGGALDVFRAEPGPGRAVRAALTYVPAFPIYPPEFAWMREPDSGLPALLDADAGSGRIVVLAADVDRQYGRLRLPDHGDLLAGIVSELAGAPLIRVDGPGYLSCVPWRAGGRLILHIVNLTGLNAWPGYAEEAVDVGPLRITVAAQVNRVTRLVSGGRLQTERTPDATVLVLPSVRDHEVLVLE